MRGEAMDAPQNPSAGKFDPPPNPTEPRQPGARVWTFGSARLWAGGVAVLSIVLRFALLTHNRRGSLGVASGLFVVGVTRYALARRVRDKRDGDGPYESHTNVTR